MTHEYLNINSFDVKTYMTPSVLYRANFKQKLKRELKPLIETTNNVLDRVIFRGSNNPAA